MTWIVARLKEPSTWNGAAIICGVLSQTFTSLGSNASTSTIVAALASAAMGVVMKEKGPSA